MNLYSLDQELSKYPIWLQYYSFSQKTKFPVNLFGVCHTGNTSFCYVCLLFISQSNVAASYYINLRTGALPPSILKFFKNDDIYKCLHLLIPKPFFKPILNYQQVSNVVIRTQVPSLIPVSSLRLQSQDGL